MGSKLELVHAIKDLQRSDPAAKQAWGQYCDEQLGGARDPARHERAVLQAFIDSFQGEGGAVPELAHAPRGAQQGADASDAVDRIKTLQRSDEGAKQAWWNYCDMHLGGKKDPTFHPADVLEEFLAKWEQGTLETEVDMNQDVEDASQPTLIQKIKFLQRTDQGAKQAWWKYCDENLGGKKDPGMHEAEQLQDFLTRYNAGELGEGAPRTSFVGAGQDYPAGELVGQVKQLQRTDHRAKEAWGKFCERGGGIRDPSRHDAAFLQEFLRSFHNGSNQPVQPPRRVQPPPPPPPTLYAQPARPMLAPEPEGRQKQCIEFIRHGCSLSQTFRTSWSRYRAEYGGELNEAAKYQAFVAEFAEYLGGLVQGDLDADGGGAGAAAPPPLEASRKRTAPAPPMGQPPVKLLRTPPPAPGARTVAIKKRIADAIRRINASGSLSQPIRLPKVAGPLAALEETTAMGILEGMEELGEIEDPSQFIVEQAQSLAR